MKEDRIRKEVRKKWVRQGRRVVGHAILLNESKPVEHKKSHDRCTIVTIALLD